MQKYCYVFLSFLMALCGCDRASAPVRPEVAVIVPLQHPAMDAIVSGLTEELGGQVVVTVYNAQGDSSLQSAIMQQLKVRGTQIVLPIGTATTQMAVRQLPDATIVHLAAKFEAGDRAPGQQVTGVLDELPPELSVDLAYAMMPELVKFTLIHSPADKIYPEVAALEARAAQHGIAVQRLLVQSQADLYTMSLQVADDSQLIVILKDHLVVAGVPTLAELARKRGIPLMACDEGSVESGASFAAGVPEAAIGRAGGRLVNRVLAGERAGDLAIESVDEVHLFFRADAAEQLPLEAAARQFGYRLHEVGS